MKRKSDAFKERTYKISRIKGWVLNGTNQVAFKDKLQKGKGHGMQEMQIPNGRKCEVALRK